MSLTNQQKVDIRRFCGVPVYGGSDNRPLTAFPYVYFDWYTQLEYRLNNLAPEEESTLQTVYLTNLYALESAIPTASNNLHTDSAAVWFHNKNEVEDRFNLFKLWCRRLIEFLGLKIPGGSLAPFQVVV